MKTRLMPLLVLTLTALLTTACLSSRPTDPQGFRQVFAVDKAALRNTGAAPYCILQPGYRLTYRSGHDTLTYTTVLNETKLVDGVETRVVEERLEQKGQVAEITRNYLAFDPATGDVYCFGEDVDAYKGGKVVGHAGSWLAGRHGARFGLLIPGHPQPGDKFYQGQAPGVALDQAEVTSVSVAVVVPAGTFTQCIDIRATTPLDPGAARLLFAPGVGLIQAADFVLIKIERL